MQARATTAAIEIAALEKSFGDRRALAGVGFAVAPGELLAVIGPNGAGKTTLLSIIAGSLDRDDGDGHDQPRVGSASCRSSRPSTGS